MSLQCEAISKSPEGNKKQLWTKNSNPLSQLLASLGSQKEQKQESVLKKNDPTVQNDSNTQLKEDVKIEDAFSQFIQSYIAKTLESSLRVSFVDLKPVYEKAQIRVGRQSKQRFKKGTGRMKIVVASEAQIRDIDVYVERTAAAAALCGDKSGQVPLKTVKLENFDWNKQTFSLDLDSVYLSPKGTPVYKLSTVDSDRRNRFRLVVVVVFIDGTRSKPFNSRQFLLKSKQTGPRN